MEEKDCDGGDGGDCAGVEVKVRYGSEGAV